MSAAPEKLLVTRTQAVELYPLTPAAAGRALPCVEGVAMVLLHVVVG
jgi:hypothetical protein